MDRLITIWFILRCILVPILDGIERRKIEKLSNKDIVCWKVKGDVWKDVLLRNTEGVRVTKSWLMWAKVWLVTSIVMGAMACGGDVKGLIFYTLYMVLVGLVIWWESRPLVMRPSFYYIIDENGVSVYGLGDGNFTGCMGWEEVVLLHKVGYNWLKLRDMRGRCFNIIYPDEIQEDVEMLMVENI